MENLILLKQRRH